MAASFDFPQPDRAVPPPHVARVCRLDRLVNRAAERSRPHLRARSQHLRVEALSAPIYLRGDMEELVDALTQLLCAGSSAAGENGLIFVSVMQVGGNATLIVRGQPGETGALTHAPYADDGQCDWLAVERLVAPHGGAISARRNEDGHLEYAMILLAVCNDCGPVGRRAPWIGGPERPVCRVLVADDNPDAADSIACLLSIRGHEVHVAYDGPSALDKAVALCPDIVLLDTELPGMDGFEVAHALRVRAAGRCPIFIAVSGYGECAEKSLFDLHLTKPIDPSVLLQAVERYAGVALSPQPQA